MTKDISRFLDGNGRIRIWPSKRDMKESVLSYLAEKFEYNKTYTEKEVNNILQEWHTFNDYFLLRRDLVDIGLLSRTRNGASYWRVESPEENCSDLQK
ncbi:MAG TPA: DUF2087 domain-containing protein [Clostridia bacterium]|nr:DUF2087 domain-containing protein [Clostridia bacterium]